MGRYGVILDAGSSGTRVHIYRWLDSARARSGASAEELKSLPRLETKKKWTKKIHPGVSTFGANPGDVGDDHLRGLLQHALEVVPESKVTDTPLFLMATAGMRLLPEGERRALLAEICAYARENTRFSLPDCALHVQVIPGETEGLYGWIAANYLLGGFDRPLEHAHGKGHHTYGFLDMGGASAQIAFAPNATEAAAHADDLKLLRMRTLDGLASEYRVFVTTWLGFGVNQARKRYVEALLAAADARLTGSGEIPDPCLPRGLVSTLAGDLVAAADNRSHGPSDDTVDGGGTRWPFLAGTGRFDECLRQTFPLLNKDAPCADEPCLLGGAHVPAIDFDVNHFVGVSEYWHTTHEVFEMAHRDKAYDFNTYQRRVSDFCGQGWDEMAAGVGAQRWGRKVDAKTAQEVCFKASWLINVLHDGIGIPRVGLERVPDGGHNGTREVLEHAREKGFLDPFQAVDKIDDTEVSWTLGKMVLYAAGQIEPRAAAGGAGSDGDAAATTTTTTTTKLPVGFGSNVASGIPEDFQYAGSTYAPTLDGGDDDAHWTETADELLHRAGTRSHGFALAVVLLLLLAFVLRKRERRHRWHIKLGNVLRRGGGGVGGAWRPGSPRKAGGGVGGALSLFGTTGKRFGRGASATHYERVLEEGDTGGASFFELQEAGAESDPEDGGGSSDATSDGSGGNNNSSSSSSMTGLRAGRSSGLATPKLGVTGFDSASYFDAAPSAQSAASTATATATATATDGVMTPVTGVGGNAALVTPGGMVNAMSRSGLVGRTESRERLSAGAGATFLGAGRRSRAASPSRGKSSLMAKLDED